MEVEQERLPELCAEFLLKTLRDMLPELMQEVLWFATVPKVR